MKDTEEAKKIIGNATVVSFPALDIENVPARVDTGARLSSIWGSAKVQDGVLHVTFFGKTSPLFTGKSHSFEHFDEVEVTSSMGHTQMRYMIVLVVRINGKRVRASFTVADRSKQTFPILVGRNILRGKFIVDVKKGKLL